MLATPMLMSPIFIYERCLDSNPESCRSKQVFTNLECKGPGEGSLCQELFPAPVPAPSAVEEAGGSALLLVQSRGSIRAGTVDHVAPLSSSYS